MKYYYDLYLDDKLIPKREEILAKLEQDKWQFEKYLITLTKNEKNHLEFYNSVLLIQKAIEKEDLFLVGIASGYESALELVEKITQEVYDKTKGTDIRNYILNKQQEYEEGNVEV